MHESNMVFWIIGNTKDSQVNKNGQTESIVCKTIKILITKMLTFVVLKTSLLYFHFMLTQQTT